MRNERAILVAAILLAACDEQSGENSEGLEPFATRLVEFDATEGSDYNHELLPDVVLGPPGGPLDVVSLGCGGSITLAFDGDIVDGPGPDLIVFENPFSTDFPEAGRVSVSPDGELWDAFDCDPASLEGCAGKTPVQAIAGSGMDATDPEVAGGDAFDLADLDLDAIRYVRIEDVSRTYWETEGADFCDPGQNGKGGFDLDAIAAVHHD